MATQIFNPDRSKTLSLATDGASITYMLTPNGKKHYYLTTAVTSGSTAVTAGSANGDTAETTNATGRGKIFYSNGTNWVLLNT